MKEIKPDFYDEFKCTADKCPQTCCQEWKIAVDEVTYSRWKKRIISDKKNCRLSDFTNIKDGSRVIKLDENNKCPFLSKDGLCSIVLKYGDDILSETCDIFPRQIHEFDDRTEYSLVTCCPAVVDMLNKYNAVDINIENGDMLFNIRKIAVSVMKNESFSVEMAFMMILYILNDIYLKNDNININEYLSPKVLEELSDAIDKLASDRSDSITERNELFLDMAENYRKEGLYTDYIEPAALLAKQIEKNYDINSLVIEYEEFEDIFGKYCSLMRNCMVMDIYSNMLIPDSDAESMIVMLQWEAMEYAVIKHTLFLRWKLDGKKNLQYDTVREYIVVISRMTGYDEEDIYEYMENSFQKLIWDWSYMALIMKN